MRLFLFISGLVGLSLFACQNNATPSDSGATATTTTQPASDQPPVPEVFRDTVFQRLEGQTMVEVIQANKNMALIDLRSPEEYKAGHIYKAINWPYEAPDCMLKFMSLDRNQPIMIYCSNTNFSWPVGDRLKAAGFQRIYTFRRGLVDWYEAGQTITSM